jgi:hypothetical protein
MRLARFLNEKWLDDVQEYGSTYEVFMNPSRKEIRQLDKSGGYRFIVNHKKKEVYMVSANSYHSTMWDESEVRNRIGFSYDSYSYNAKGFDYIYCGDGITNGRYGSDTMETLGTNYPNQLEKLANQDWSWVKKYLNTDEIISNINWYLDQHKLPKVKRP